MERKSYYVKLTIREEIVEERPDFAVFSARERIDFRSLVDVIRAARQKKRVAALLLVIKRSSLGWSQIEELHRELDEFHEAGKESVALLEASDNSSFFLACGTRRVCLLPAGGLDLVGLRVETHHFYDLLDLLGIQPELFNVGEYKSAAEIFTRREMSEASRQMTDSILEDIQRRLRERVASQRGVSPDRVQEWIDRGPYTASEAKRLGLVDDLAYEDELEKELESGKPGLKLLPVSKLPIREGFLKRLATRWRPQIAYVVIEGLLTLGTSRRGPGRPATAGADTIRGLLEHARRSKRIKAVLLRVNSPGGSGVASDLIWREVRRTSEKKPVIVSFGNTAASGGYYLATAGDQLLAMPNTLTGSIGVIAGKFNIENLLRKVKISVDSIDKGERAGYVSASRPFSEGEAAAVKEQMEEFYRIFLSRVAESRSRPMDEVSEVAQGRVWTGNQALQHGLIDSFGGISEALELARDRAGIPAKKKFRVVQFSPRRSLRDLLPLPLLESGAGNRIWALMPQRWIIR